MLLLIVDKLASARLLADLHLINPEETDIVCTYGFNLWEPEYPDISRSEIPYIQLPDTWKTSNSAKNDAARNMHLLIRNGKVAVKTTNSKLKDKDLKAMMSCLTNSITKYTETVCFVTPNREICGGVNQLLEKLFSNGDRPVVTIVPMLDFQSHSDLIRSWKSRDAGRWDIKQRSWFSILTKQHQCELIFNYLWHINSDVVFSELCAVSRLKISPALSVYELMTMLLISRNDRSLTDSDVMHRLEKWEESERSEQSVTLGTEDIRTDVVSQLKSRGCVETKGRRELLTLNKKGTDFIKALHKNTLDAELPLKLDAWVHECDLEGILSYVRSFFERQYLTQTKRY